MAVFTQESLERLRGSVDLYEVLASRIDLKSAGATYKAICPFHEEKTPSFVMKKGDNHYHCFGCGAHGDAIAFLMHFEKLNFVEAAEHLAARFDIVLETVQKGPENKGPSKEKMRQALELAAAFYHLHLLHSDEGRLALSYLYQRGIDNAFIQTFGVGYAPKSGDLFLETMQKSQVSLDVLECVGLLSSNKQQRPFFAERILFPIQNSMGLLVGFSGRKLNKDSFGPKYINTQETVFFKKNKLLFGLHHCRQRIAKEKRALIVEGQIDCLRLINAGLNLAVASQGTAFGEEHKEILLRLGVEKIYLAFDSDSAGQKATYLVGEMFQKEGVEVLVLSLPEGEDPDLLLRKEGVERFIERLNSSVDYLSFLIQHVGAPFDLRSPSQKNQFLQKMLKQVKGWAHPLMVHESLRRLAHMLSVPERLLGIQPSEEERRPFSIKKSGTLSSINVDLDRVLEIDLLRWLVLMGKEEKTVIELVRKNIQPKHLGNKSCRRLFVWIMEEYEKGNSVDLLSAASDMCNVDDQLLLSEMIQKKVNKERALLGVQNTIEQLLKKHWLQEREKIQLEIQRGGCSQERVMELAKAFDTLKKNPPMLVI